MTVVRAATAAGSAALAFAVALRLSPPVAGGEAITGPGGLTGWMGPLMAAIVVGGVIVAMGGVRRDSGSMANMIECVECGGPVRSEWRLCPHCGSRLGQVDSDDDTVETMEGRGLDG